MTPLENICPDCDGDGEIWTLGESHNPYTGMRGRDPQHDHSVRCDRCNGQGTIQRKPPARARVERLPDGMTVEDFIRPVQDNGDERERAA